MSFGGEASGSVAKCGLFSQARGWWECGQRVGDLIKIKNFGQFLEGGKGYVHQIKLKLPTLEPIPFILNVTMLILTYIVNTINYSLVIIAC